MPLLTARDVEDVLAQWEGGQLTSNELHAWAESRYLVDEWETDSEITNEILGHLDRMDMNLVMRQDVPRLKQALGVKTVADALRMIDECYRITSIDERKRLCAGESFYAPFCR